MDEQSIYQTLLAYTACSSATNTEEENNASAFVYHYLAQLEYFQNHPNQYGLRFIHNDTHNRSVAWGLLLGQGNDTIVLMHHLDTVDTTCYGSLKPYAFQPERLMQEMKQRKDQWNEEVNRDLFSNTYLFGRGVADMKGGGAVQLAMMKQFSQTELKGNLLLIAVGDEENLSAGMREAVILLSELKKQYHLSYRLMIDSEPQQRTDTTRGNIAIGSIGKIMPFAYVKGVPVHVCDSALGYNPTALLGQIIADTEAHQSFQEQSGQETTPPPTWLYARDNKNQYDVTLPDSALGCYSILTHRSNVEEILTKFTTLIEQSCATYQKKHAFNRNIPVYSFSNWQKSCTISQEERTLLQQELNQSSFSVIEANFRLLDAFSHHTEASAPYVVIGLVPPYYPGVNSRDGHEHTILLAEELCQYIKNTYHQDYTIQEFYPAISDLSYSQTCSAALKDEMPLFGWGYQLPLTELAEIAMPCMNIGPYGKDLHQVSERVLRNDVCTIIPDILSQLIRQLIG